MAASPSTLSPPPLPRAQKSTSPFQHPPSFVPTTPVPPSLCCVSSPSCLRFTSTSLPLLTSSTTGGTVDKHSTSPESSPPPVIKCIVTSCRNKHLEVFTHIAKSASCGTISHDRSHLAATATPQSGCSKSLSITHSGKDFKSPSSLHQLGSPRKTRRQESKNSFIVNAYEKGKTHDYSSTNSHTYSDRILKHQCNETKPVVGFSGIVYVKNQMDIRKLTRNHNNIDQSFEREKITYKSHSLMILRTPKCTRNQSEMVNGRSRCRCVMALFRHHSYTFTNHNDIKKNRDQEHRKHSHHSQTFAVHKNRDNRDHRRGNQNDKKSNRDQDCYHRNLNHSEGETEQDHHTDSDHTTATAKIISQCITDGLGGNRSHHHSSASTTGFTTTKRNHVYGNQELSSSSPSCIAVSKVKDEGLPHHPQAISVYCQSTPSHSCGLDNLVSNSASQSAKNQIGGIKNQGDLHHCHLQGYVTERDPKDFKPTVNRNVWGSCRIRNGFESRDRAHASFTKMLILISTTFLIMHLPA